MTKEAKILIAIMAIVVGGGLFAAFSGGPSATNTEALVRENSHKLGSGAVQVVEFGDYQCPACGQTYPTTKRLVEEYEGKITFVYRNFPLPGHQNAMPAALAAEAAAAQGKFWEMNGRLFENQEEWSGVADPTSIFVRYASDFGLDAEKFKKDLDAKTYEDVISDDQSDGYDMGIRGTPTFFINGKQQLDFDYDSLKQAIDAELK